MILCSDIIYRLYRPFCARMGKEKKISFGLKKRKYMVVKEEKKEKKKK